MRDMKLEIESNEEYKIGLTTSDNFTPLDYILHMTKRENDQVLKVPKGFKKLLKLEIEIDWELANKEDWQIHGIKLSNIIEE